MWYVKTRMAIEGFIQRPGRPAGSLRRPLTGYSSFAPLGPAGRDWPVPNPHLALAQALADRVGKILASNPKKLILVRGDKAVDYERVVGLMAALQRAGAPSVGLVTE